MGEGRTGSAPVDFVLVGSLLTLVFLAIVQLALVLHVKNTLTDAASSGAYYGVLADRKPADGVERAKAVIGTAISPDFAKNVTYTVSTVDGVQTLSVTVKAAIPLFGLIGPDSVLEVTGHAALQQ